MTVHVFEFTDWYAVPDGHGCIDWDCDFQYLVIDNRTIRFLEANSQFYQDQMRSTYPDRKEHKVSISRHRGKLENSQGIEDLKENFPHLWETLDDWCPFKD